MKTVRIAAVMSSLTLSLVTLLTPGAAQTLVSGPPTQGDPSATVTVSPEEFRRIEAWTGNAPINPDTDTGATDLAEFLLHTEGGQLVQQWLSTVKAQPGYQDAASFTTSSAPDTMHRYTTSMGTDIGDTTLTKLEGTSGDPVLDYLIEQEPGVLETWMQTLVHQGIQDLDAYVRERAPDYVTKWKQVIGAPGFNIPLDQWQGGGPLDALRPTSHDCSCIAVQSSNHFPYPAYENENWDIRKTREQLWRRIRGNMAAHSVEMYAMGDKRLLQVSDIKYKSEHRTEIQVMTLCRDSSNLLCTGCAARADVLGTYATNVSAKVHTWGNYFLNNHISESGASDKAVLTIGPPGLNYVLFDKGVADKASVYNEYNRGAIGGFVSALKGMGFSEFRNAAIAGASDKLRDTSVKLLKSLITRANPDQKHTDVTSQAMRAEYDTTRDPIHGFSLWPNEPWTLTLNSEGRVAYFGEGKHRTPGLPEATYFGSSAALAVAVHSFLCPVDVVAQPRPFIVWAHSRDPLSYEIVGPGQNASRIAEFAQSIFGQAPANGAQPEEGVHVY